MANSSFTIGNLVQDVTIDALQIQGFGDDICPMLRIPFILDIHLKDEDFPFLIQSINATLSVNGVHNPIAEVSVISNCNVFYKGAKNFYLDFPLTQQKIERIEKGRSGDLRCDVRMDFHFTFSQEHIGPWSTPVRLYSTFDNKNVSINFEIPQSHWVKILPALHYKAFLLFEIQVSQDLIGEKYLESLKELQLAQSYFIKSDYDKCVAHCRSAIDPIKSKLPELKEIIGSNSEFEWMKIISSATSEWYEKIAKATANFTSKTHHIRSTGYFSRSEAEVVYMVTVAIVKYASDLRK